MKLTNAVSILILLFIVASCFISRSKLETSNADIELALQMAIYDFATTYQTQEYYLEKRDGKPFDIFRVNIEKETDSDLFVIGIFPRINTISLFIKHRIGEVPENNFPTRYIEFEDKLFVWKDSITPLSKEILDVLDTYNILDSTDVKRELGLLPDDIEDTRMVTTDRRLKSIHYYICKNNINKYEKVLTNVAYGYYEPPKLNCVE